MIKALLLAASPSILLLLVSIVWTYFDQRKVRGMLAVQPR